MPLFYFAAVHPSTGLVHVRGSRDDYGYVWAAISHDALWGAFSATRQGAEAALREGRGSLVVPATRIPAKLARAIKANRGRMPVAAPAQAEPVAAPVAAPAQAEPVAAPVEAPAQAAALPTTETYAALQTAYDAFNAALFGGSLPPCLITLQRKEARVMGYYSPERFAAADGSTTDEIAMNPAHFGGSIDETLSTLAHEMAHLWQAHHGKPSRAGYHNAEWAAEMDRIGLPPTSSDGKGARTGQKMTHTIAPGGPFAQAAAALLADGAFRLRWREVARATADKAKKPATRAKFSCPTCGANAWAKPAARLICGECELPMRAEGVEDGADAEGGA